MNIRHIVPLLFALLLLAAAPGCKKADSDVPAPAPEPALLSPDTVARVHWAGKRQLGLSAGAYYLVRLWELPETKRVEVQFLKDMAVAPWRIKFGEAAVANAPAALFGPLLQDVIKEECYFEVRHGTDQPCELAFAIKLDDERAGVWRTNLVGVIASLTGIQNMDIMDGGQAWALRQEAEPSHFKLSRVGEWTVVGIGQEDIELMEEVAGRIQKFGDPSALSPGSWLEVNLDLHRLLGARFEQRGLSGILPRISLMATGDGGNVITRGTMTFPESVQLEHKPWQIPTNLLHEPLESFAALQGIGGWLSDWKVWNQLQIGAPPDQLFLWGLEGDPYQTYLAAPLPNAWDGVRELATRAVEKGNPWLEEHGYVGFEPLPGTNGAIWGNLPQIRPFFTAVANEAFTGVYAGLLPPVGQGTNEPVRREIIDTISGSTNLVAYHWENTGSRIEASIGIGQFARLMSRKPLLPLESVSGTWLQSIAPRLAETETKVFLTGSNLLSFERKSSTGLTAPELGFLVDWFESPKFPVGLHTTMASPDAPPPTE